MGLVARSREWQRHLRGAHHCLGCTHRIAAMVWRPSNEHANAVLTRQQESCLPIHHWPPVDQYRLTHCATDSISLARGYNGPA
jgi:hypothetical protein